MSIDARKVRAYALMLAACAALWRAAVWIAWGIWAVTR